MLLGTPSLSHQSNVVSSIVLGNYVTAGVAATANIVACMLLHKWSLYKSQHSKSEISSCAKHVHTNDYYLLIEANYDVVEPFSRAVQKVLQKCTYYYTEKQPKTFTT